MSTPFLSVYVAVVGLGLLPPRPDIVRDAAE
jgi:hypothetical protein